MSDGRLNIPALLIATASGAITSISAGFVIASYAMSGMTPAYAVPPRVIAKAPSSEPSNSWHDSGYERVGLWESGRADTAHDAI